MWISLDERVVEHLRLAGDEHGILADGLSVHRGAAASFRLAYTIHCDSLWRVREVDVRTLGPPAPRRPDAPVPDRPSPPVPGTPDQPAPPLVLRSDGEGRWWSAGGEAIPSLTGCRDVDIFYSPFTNTPAIRRLALKPGESADIHVAFVAVPGLTVAPVRQRYTCLRAAAAGAVYRYEAVESGFSAELLVDADGMVIEYPGFFRRAAEGAPGHAGALRRPAAGEHRDG